MVQITEPNGRSLGWFSGGSLKFKGVNRASYEAGYQCAVAAFQVIKQVVQEKGDIQVELYFRGFGQGREAMKTALLAVEGTEVRRLVSLIQDRTPIKIGGTRAPKARRL
jgi:small subunit ribosomal protein S11